MTTVYLDQNKWIDLSRAHHGEKGGGRYEEVLAKIAAGVNDGRASFPVSAGHYFETWEHHKGPRRRGLGALMSDISRFRTIGDQRTITIAEIDAALVRQFGVPQQPRTAEVFGYGAAHAFGVAELADYRSIAANDSRYTGLDPTIADLFERETLSGPPADLPVAGIAQPDLNAARSYAEGENELASAFQAHNTPRDEQERTIAAQELSSLLELIVPALARAEIPVDDFLGLGAETLTELMLSMPWRGSVLTLRQRRHREAHQRWHANDLDDVSYLTLGLAYCDILVAEKQWASRMRAAGLDQRCTTLVLTDLRELAEHL